MNIHVYIYVYTNIYICIYIYIHTCVCTYIHLTISKAVTVSCVSPKMCEFVSCGEGVGWPDRASVGRIGRQLGGWGVGWPDRASVGRIRRQLTE